MSLHVRFVQLQCVHVYVVCASNISACLFLHSTVLCFCMLFFCSTPAYVSTEVCLYMYKSVFFVCLQHRMNVSLLIFKRLRYHNGSKQFSNFLVKEESVQSDAFSRISD